MRTSSILPCIVLQALYEGRLQLREERLQSHSTFIDQYPKSAQDRTFDLPREPVSYDSDQGPAHKKIS
jgi:hypothetical protein